MDGMKDWTPEELVFNAIAWNKGYRFFGCSRDLSIVMKRIKKENQAFYWFSTSLYLHNEAGELVEKVLRKNPEWKMII